MLHQLTIEKFEQMLGKYNTADLEGMVHKFPYFQQAHLLLAKKYQQENDPRFDQQLQLAALYVQDRELLFNLFNEKKLLYSAQKQISEVVPEVEPFASPVVENEPVSETVEHELNSAIENPAEVNVEENQTQDDVASAQPPMQDEVKIFSRFEPHTFDEWLTAFNKPQEPVVSKISPVDSPTQDETEQDLDNLIKQNISVDYLHKLVQEETQYSRGLDKFIEEQIEKHKYESSANPSPADAISPDLITETMAKVYEMQKKYSKAIKAYEILTLKFPEKSSLFAERISYLKSII